LNKGYAGASKSLSQDWCVRWSIGLSYSFW